MPRQRLPLLLLPWMTSVCTSVYRRLAFRTRLPAAVNPEPLVGILANHFFQFRLQGLSIAGEIAGNGERRGETKDVAALPIAPEGEAGNHGGAGMRGEFGEAGAGAGFLAEEVDEDAVGDAGVLIGQDTHGLIRGQGFENRAAEIFLADGHVSRESAAAFDHRIEIRIVERTHNHVPRSEDK